MERRLVESRRQADPTFDAAFQRVIAVWEGTMSPRDSVNVGPRVPEAAIIELADLPSPVAAGPGGARLRGWMLAAAACLAAVLGWGLAMGRSGEAELEREAVFTGPDEIATVTLEDGTLVRLAPNSRLSWGGSGRTVELEGRAFFVVVHRDGRPFMVRLPHRLITVLGTRFDVDERGEETRVAVVEGEVRISGGGGFDTSVSKDQVAYGPDTGHLVVQAVDDVFESIEWMGPFLAFESTPLPDVGTELLRRFGVRITIDEALSSRTVTGWFTNQTVEGMIAAICTAVAAQCSMSEMNVLMEVQPLSAGPSHALPQSTGP
jgi:ferric-dicitrate binding protein FerR (iron transport regulator)